MWHALVILENTDSHCICTPVPCLTRYCQFNNDNGLVNMIQRHLNDAWEVQLLVQVYLKCPVTV